MAVFLRFLILALYAVLLGRVLWSWIDPTFRGPIGRFLFETTEPILAPIRRFLPTGRHARLVAHRGLHRADDRGRRLRPALTVVDAPDRAVG